MLADICHQRRVIQGLWQFKKLNVSGTGNKPNTQLITLYKHFDNKTKQFSQRYWTVWQAMILNLDSPWSMCLEELKDIDIHGPGKDLDNTCSSNSCYEPSWIWLMPCVTSESNKPEGGMHTEEFNDHMHVEWAKAQACVMWWKEELLLCRRKCGESTNITSGKLPGGVCVVLYERTMMLVFLVVFWGMHISRWQFLCAWLLNVLITGCHGWRANTLHHHGQPNIQILLTLLFLILV